MLCQTISKDILPLLLQKKRKKKEGEHNFICGVIIGEKLKHHLKK